MTQFEFASTINSMPVEKQNEFFETLKGVLSEEDWLTTVKFVGLWGMLNCPAKYKAMKNAVHDQLCEEFFGHIVEPQKNISEELSDIYAYSNSIL